MRAGFIGDLILTREAGRGLRERIPHDAVVVAHLVTQRL